MCLIRKSHSKLKYGGNETMNEPSGEKKEMMKRGGKLGCKK